MNTVKTVHLINFIEMAEIILDDMSESWSRRDIVGAETLAGILTQRLFEMKGDEYLRALIDVRKEMRDNE